MGQVYGATKQELLLDYFESAKQQMNQFVSEQKGYFDMIEDSLQKEQAQAGSFGWTVLSMAPTFTQGIIDGTIDVYTTTISVISNFLNNASHIFDEQDGTDWKTDIKFMGADLLATAIEGIGAGGSGFAADALSLFGVDPKWAYDEKIGFIPNLSRSMNEFRADVLRGDSALEDFQEPFKPREDSRDVVNETILDERWNTDDSNEGGFSIDQHQSTSQEAERLWDKITGQKPTLKNDNFLSDNLAPISNMNQEDFRNFIYQNMMNQVGNSKLWKKHVAKATGEALFQEKAGNHWAYNLQKPVFESIGRLMPSIIMGKMSKTAGANAKTLANASKLWFAAGAAGSAFEEAITNKASLQDAYTYAFGNMALELGTEQLGGYVLGEGLRIKSPKDFFSSIFSEGMEEAIAELGGRGLGYYSNKDNEIDTSESSKELIQRTAYAALVGSISGGIFAGGSMVGRLGTQGKIRDLHYGVKQSVAENGVEKTADFLQKTTNKIEKVMESEKVSEAKKEELMEDPIIKQIFDKKTETVKKPDDNGNMVEQEVTSYELNDLGKKLQEGKIMAQQGDQTIDKETHAVGGDVYLTEYAEEVTVHNTKNNKFEKRKIKIVEKSKLKNHKNGKIAQEVLDKNWKVAFVEIPGQNVENTSYKYKSHVDTESGITYININAPNAIENLLAHETHDQIYDMAQNGQLTKQEKKSYLKFLNNFDENITPKMLKKLNVGFNEDLYRKVYQGRENIESLIQAEKVSAFIEQAMDNKAIIKEGLKGNKNLFQKIGNIFTRKLSYNKMINKMGLDPKADKELIKTMGKLQKNFADAIRENEQNLKITKDMVHSLMTKEVMEGMFSLDSNHGARLTQLYLHEKPGRLIAIDFKNKLPLTMEEFTLPENIHAFMTNVESVHPQEYTIITEENNPELYKKGYFLEFKNNYYNKNDFKVNEDLVIYDMKFSRSLNIFEVTLRGRSEHEYDLDEPEMRTIKRQISPDYIKKNGEIIKNPVYFETSFDNFRSEQLLNKGYIPAQSFSMARVSGSYYQTNQYGAGTFVLKPDKMFQKEDFNLFKTDIFSQSVNFHPQKNTVDFILESKTVGKDVPDVNKMQHFYFLLEHNLNYFAEFSEFNKVMSDVTMEYVQMAENNFFLPADVVDLSARMKTGDILTKKEIKQNLKDSSDLTKNIFQIHDQAVDSLFDIVNANTNRPNIKEFFNTLAWAREAKKDNPSKALKKEANLNLYELYSEEFDNIIEYLQMVPHNFDMTFMPEGKSMIKPEDIDFIIFDEGFYLDSYQQFEKVEEQIKLERALLEKAAQKYNIPIIDKRGIKEHKEETYGSLEKNMFSLDSEAKTIFDTNVSDMKEKAKGIEQDINTSNEQSVFNFKELSVETENKTNEEILDTEQDFLNNAEKENVLNTVTSSTKASFATTVSKQGNTRVVKNVNRFEKAIQESQKVTKQDYKRFERDFVNNFEEIQKRLDNPKNKFDKAIKKLYGSWEYYINKERSNNQFYNHMGSQVSKTVINELNTLAKIIQNNKQRKDKTPTDLELEYIAEKVNRAIFQTLDYVDKDVIIEINKNNEHNPEGYAFTRAMYWYLRDMKKQVTWDKETTESFNRDGRGFAYRRLINAVLNFNKKNGAKELQQAVNQFNQMTNVENVNDLALDGNGPRTTKATVKKQWERNSQNINLIEETIGYKARTGSWLDAFTVGEAHGQYNENSWTMVLNDRLMRGTKRALLIEREFKQNFEKDDWLKKNYKQLVQMDKQKNAIEIQNLNNVEVRPTQIIYLRNMLLREIARNRAIDLDILRGEKTHHFDNGNEVDILAKSEYRDKKRDNKKIGIIKDQMALLKELEGLINSNSFWQEYNRKVIDFFNDMYPYVNERFKEINGMNLSNDGRGIAEAFETADDTIKDSMLYGFPDTITEEDLGRIYIPFLMDDSSYFKSHKVDFSNSIIDLGVFDGMTEELSDNDGIISVDGITNVLSSYNREVANYYGFHRIMTDLNTILNERLEGHKQTVYQGRNIPKSILTYYENLLNDMAGYRALPSNPGLHKTLSWARRNFYRASLGLNLKVMGSQVTTMFNLSNLYGTHFTEMFPKMAKNFIAQHTKTNKKRIDYLEKNNHIYWDRKRTSTFEIGEATKEGFSSNNRFNRTMQAFMNGIRFTDASINRALYLTLLDTVNPKTGKNYTQQEASETVERAIIRSQSSTVALSRSPLLRTNNEVFRVMVKFLGEPMKLITQAYNSHKQIQFIRKLEKNKDLVFKKLEAIENEARKEFEEARKFLNELQGKENSPDFATLSEQEQKAIKKQIKEKKKEYKTKETAYNEAQENTMRVKEKIRETLANKNEAIKLAKKRYTAVLVATLYLTMLRSGFELMRSKFGKKDKPEEQAYTEYLTVMLGNNFLDSSMGMFPFVRDAYQVVSTGFQFNDIDEFDAANDLFVSFNYLLKAVSDGKELNLGKTTRSIAMASGRLIGMPVWQIERLFTTPVLYINESLHYRYNNAVGKRTRHNIELKEAIKKDDDRMIEALIDTKINERGIKVSNPTLEELMRLAKKGKEVSFSGVNDSYTVNSVKYELTRFQKQEFAKVYNKADYVIQKIIKSGKYRRLNTDMKESLLKAIYAYYYKMAKQEVLGVEMIAEENYFPTMIRAYKYFLERAENLYERQNKLSYIQQQREQKKEATA